MFYKPTRGILAINHEYKCFPTVCYPDILLPKLPPFAMRHPRHLWVEAPTTSFGRGSYHILRNSHGGAVALTRWIEKMESVINNSGCLANKRVKYATSSFIGKALTWWNTQVQARGQDAANAMAWDDFKALLTTEFCPSNEIEKLEGGFWNHSMDWLSNQKALIVWHEKIVRILVEEGKVLYVQEERNVRKTKMLMSTNANELTLNDIPIVHDFEDVFPDDLSGLSPQ
ncbi:reverse transcriptase domain-containing protein [Tanacetum coccineum]